MDTQEENKETRFFTVLFATVLLLLTGFIFATNNIVLAQEQDYGTEYNIKEIVFKTDTQLERSSRRPKIVHIKKGEYVYCVFTLETNIYRILDEYGIQISGDEKISISTEYIADGSLVRLIKTETVIEEISLNIPYSTTIIKSDKYLLGEENIAQEGVLGIRKQRMLSYYEDGVLVESKILAESVAKEPVTRVVEVGTSMYSLDGIDSKGYNCPYWYSVVDSGPYTDEEKRWLKFVMHCESGCNAESTKGTFKGLFQWSPKWWRKQFSENIFDGHAQIKNTVGKYRAGESTRKSQWPKCHQRYVETYGSN